MPKSYHFHYDNGTYTVVHAPWQVINELLKDGDTKFIILTDSKPAFKLDVVEEIQDEQENQTQAQEES